MSPLSASVADLNSREQSEPMETKSKKTRPLDQPAEIQKAVHFVQQAARQVAGYFSAAAEADRYLQDAQESLSDALSRLLSLQEKAKRGRSPRSRTGSVPARRKHMDGGRSKVPRLDPPKPSARVRKRVPRKPTREGYHVNDAIVFVPL